MAGNMLVGPETVEAILAFYESHSGGDFIDRLLNALEAGQEAGGDQRGRQSGAIKVASDQEFPCCDLRVDEHVNPIAELRRIVGVARTQLFPFLHNLPTRLDPGKGTPDTVGELLTRPVTERGSASVD